MKTLLQNFSHTFRRFFTASLLNLAGLCIAFASFFAIMTQVDYENSFNKGYKDYRRIFRADVFAENNSKGQYILSRPIGELLGSSSPHIQAASLYSTSVFPTDIEVNGHWFCEPFCYGFGNFLEVFQPEMVCGSASALEQPQHVLISRSAAMRLFGRTDVEGKSIFSGRNDYKQQLTVGGVYEDFPKNSETGNCIFTAFRPYQDKDNWTNWNYTCYLRLDDGAAVEDVRQSALKTLRDALPGEEVPDGFFHFTPLEDVHFSPIGNKNPGNKTTGYLLTCVSFLIVVIAAINFTNFSLAETPMRIRSINTQKVLGASTAKLRLYLIGESTLVSVTACGLAMLGLYLLKDGLLSGLTEASLNPASHPALAGMTVGLSVAMGLLAGIYPAIYATSFPPALALKGSFGLSPKGKLLRTLLIAVQFAVSFALAISIGIMYLQSRLIRVSDYGYDKEAILTANVTPEIIRQSEAVVGELSALSGVEGASLSHCILSSADSYMTWSREADGKAMTFECLPVDYRFLSVMGIRITEGRDFKASDRDVYIFNEAARKEYPWLKAGLPALPGDYPVVGFCENVKFSTFRNDDDSRPLAFMIFGKDHANWSWQNVLNIRTAKGTDKVEVFRKVRQTLEKFTPGHDFNLRFIDDVLNEAYRREMQFSKQILLFSLIAVALSITGVFGLTLFESEYRRKEIGIRKIMGSSTREILCMFNYRYLRILAASFCVAVPTGWWISHKWLEGFAEKTPIRLWVFLAVFLLIAGVTVLAVTFQSWKNASENPANSLKSE